MNIGAPWTQDPIATPAVTSAASLMPSSPSPSTRRLLPVPSWAEFGRQRPKRLAEWRSNKRRMAAANRSNTRLDFVMYGDSITAYHIHDPSVWNKHFPERAEPMAMGGSTVSELMWRIAKGGELPARNPRNVAILIGINDLKNARTDPSDRMAFLVRWLRAALPSTTVYVVALLPNKIKNVSSINAKYRAIARDQGVKYVECGQDMDPNDTSLFKDGTHPTARGQDRVLRCLRNAIRRHSKK
jgi:hypothetical protein